MQSLWRHGWVCFIISAAAGLMMVTSESLWIDEGQTLRFASQPSFPDLLTTLLHSIKSEAQMPLGMLASWAGAKVLGVGEWQLRAVNLLWLGLAGMATGMSGRLLKLPALLLIFLIHPFLWFYVNEARPYAMQICAASWLVYVLARASTNATLTRGDLWVFGWAAFIGYGSSLLFAFGLFGTSVAALLLWKRGKLQWQGGAGQWFPIITTAAVVGSMTIYYLYTLSRGASGARLWNVSPLNLAFAFYETLGFVGLGPPRNELRELARTPPQLFEVLLLPRFLFGLGAGAIVYILVTLRAWNRRRDPLLQWSFASVVAISLSLYAGATVMHFPFWGRHLAPLLPFLLVLIARLVHPEAREHGFARRYGLIIGWVTCLAVSSLVLRFGPDHRKDDYKNASHLARAALESGRLVWWSADSEECAVYYGLKNNPALPFPERLIFCYNATAEEIAGRTLPDLVFVSKPDVHDVRGSLMAFLKQNQQQYQVTRRLAAFTIWERTIPTPPRTPTPEDR